MCQPRRWVVGLLPLIGLFLIAGLWRHSSIEQELGARGTAALAAAGFGWANLAGDGRDTNVTGEAPSPEARRGALALVEGVSGIRRAADSMSVLPEAKPFVLTAMRDGAKLTLAGSVPPGEARAALVAAARQALPGATIVDEAKPARGAPAGFAILTAFGLGELARLGEGTMTVSDTTLSISGRAVDFAGFDAIRSRLAAIPAGGALGKGLGPDDILPPIVRPFTFAVERSAAGTILSGFAPSEAARSAVLAAARSIGGPLTDQLRVAGGAPAGDWTGAAGMLTRELARLESGKASLSDDKATIIGKGSDTIAEDDVRASLAALPQGYALVQASIESRAIRPYSFSALRGEGSLALSGYVPDARARAELLDLSRRYFEGDRIEDRLNEGVGAPEGFVNTARAGLQGLSRLAPGAALTLVNRSAALKGQALVDAARDEVAADFRREIPPGFAGAIDVTTAPLPPPIAAGPECQILYQDALSRGTIRFPTGAADLSSESRGLLDRLALVTLRCANARIEIGGHTDTDGNPQANAEFSRRRAEAVAAYLARSGVRPERLEAVGYGQSVPVAPNDTPENKAKNRRIEFVVK